MPDEADEVTLGDDVLDELDGGEEIEEELSEEGVLTGEEDDEKDPFADDVEELA